jgi:hypothetical protein
MAYNLIHKFKLLDLLTFYDIVYSVWRLATGSKSGGSEFESR